MNFTFEKRQVDNLADEQGTVKIGTELNEDGLKKGLGGIGNLAQKGFGTMKSVAEAACSATLKAVTAIGSASMASVTAIVKSATESYAEYEQLTGGIDTLFKSSYDTVMNYANNAFVTAGMSSNKYMETVTSFSASLLQGLGGDTEQAAQIANLAIIDMSDNANKMGSDMESIQNAYQGFAKQNYTMLDNLKLGYGGTQQEMIRLINDSGILEEKIQSLDNISFAQMIQAIHEVQTKLDITGTTSKEAATTIEGSVNSAKAAWGNLVTGVADDTQDFDVLVDNFVQSTITAADNIIPRITTALNGAGKLVSQLLPEITKEIPEILSGILPGLFSAGKQMTIQIITGLSSQMPQIAGYGKEIFQNLLNSAIQLAPNALEAGTSFINELGEGIGEGIPVALESAMLLLEELSNTFIEKAPDMLDAGMNLLSNIVSGFVNALPELLPKALDIIQNLGDMLAAKAPDLIQQGFQILSNLISGIISALPTLIARVPEIVSTFANIINDNFPTILQKGAELLWQLIKGIISVIPDLIKNMPQIISAIVDVISAFDWLNLGKNIITFLGNGILKMASFVKTAGKTIFETIKNCIVHLPTTLLNLGQNAFKLLGKGISSVGPEILGKVRGIASSLINIFKNINLKEIGKNVLKGLWEGIKNTKDWLVEKIKGLGGVVTKAVKDALGIHSPSRVMRDEVGKFIPEGIAVGIKDKEPELIKQSEETASDTVDAMRSKSMRAKTFVSAMQGKAFSASNEAANEKAELTRDSQSDASDTAVLEIDYDKMAEANAKALNNTEFKVGDREFARLVRKVVPV